MASLISAGFFALGRESKLSGTSAKKHVSCMGEKITILRSAGMQNDSYEIIDQGLLIVELQISRRFANLRIRIDAQSGQTSSHVLNTAHELQTVYRVQRQSVVKLAKVLSVYGYLKNRVNR